MAPSRHDWKIVDWDVKPQHNQPTTNFTSSQIMNKNNVKIKCKFLYRDEIRFSDIHQWVPFKVNMAPFRHLFAARDLMCSHLHECQKNEIYFLIVWPCHQKKEKLQQIKARAWQNQQNYLCTQGTLWSAWAYVQSDERLCCPHGETLCLLLCIWVHSEDWTDWVDTQADLSLRWVHVILLVLLCSGSLIKVAIG